MNEREIEPTNEDMMLYLILPQEQIRLFRSIDGQKALQNHALQLVHQSFLKDLVFLRALLQSNQFNFLEQI